MVCNWFCTLPWVKQALPSTLSIRKCSVTTSPSSHLSCSWYYQTARYLSISITFYTFSPTAHSTTEVMNLTYLLSVQLRIIKIVSYCAQEANKIRRSKKEVCTYYITFTLSPPTKDLLTTTCASSLESVATLGVEYIRYHMYKAAR